MTRNQDRWERDVVAPWLEDNPERQAEFSTISGLPLERCYAREETKMASVTDQDNLGFPGEYPFTRGVNPSMYRRDHWVMGLYSGFGSAKEANTRYRKLLAEGQTGFSVALDLPTQCGYDADHPLAAGEVGKVGVHIGSLADMEQLFDGIPLEKVRQIRTTANAIGPIITAMYIALFEKQGVDPAAASMFVQNDSLKEYIARGTYIFPPEAGLKLSSDVIEYCARNDLRDWTPLAMSGYHIRDSGSTAVQEVAFTFANGIAYIDETLSRGLQIDEFVSQIWTFLSSGVDFLEEVAKFRAARRVWARLMKERYGATNPESMKLKIFAYTLGGNLVAQQPINNVARVAIETLAAVLGGVQTIATSSYDEAYSIPTEHAATVALRTQQIVAHETGVAGTVDSLGGSYAIESLTDRMEEQIFGYLEKIDSHGGAISCIDNGYFKKTLSDTAYEYQQQIETGSRVLVGVNRFRSDEESSIPVFTGDPDTEARQIERLQKLRLERDENLVRLALANVVDASRGGDNLMGVLTEAVRAYATMGELCDAMREVYGDYTPTVFV